MAYSYMSYIEKGAYRDAHLQLLLYVYNLILNTLTTLKRGSPEGPSLWGEGFRGWPPDSNIPKGYLEPPTNRGFGGQNSTRISISIIW